LLIRADLRSPEIRIDLHWLTQQRQMLGVTRFLDLLHEQLSADDAQALLRLLDDFASSARDEGVETAAEGQGAPAAEPGDRTSAASLETPSAPQPVLPPEAQAEIQALHNLPDDALWTIAREQMPEEVQARAHELMEKNSRGVITDDEHAELETLVARGDQYMLQKAEATAIL
jgi:hypothetical protein